MRQTFCIILLLNCFSGTAQELFTYSEPASNMAVKSVGLRVNNTLMNEASSGKFNYHLIPEIMWGASRKLMIHLDAFMSNRNRRFIAEGGSLYVKYRFYSQDEVHNHLRIAAYSRLSYNKTDIHQPAIDLYGHNSGYEAGIVLTKLANKIAVSGGSSVIYATDNGSRNKFPFSNRYRNAIAFNLSMGKLMLPKEYINYEQTNMNIMVELLGQTNAASGKTFIDLAPSVQFIFFSRTRIDLGYRFPLVDDLIRTSPNGFLLRLEYNIFNAYK